MLLKILSLFSKIMALFGRVASEKAFEKPLSPEEERREFDKLNSGDKSAENTLVKHNLRLVAHVANKYKGKLAQDELISVGSIGLLKAIKTFDYSKNNSFSTYATRCIENEILMLMRSNKKYDKQVYLEDVIMTDKDGNDMSLLDILPNSGPDMAEVINNKIDFEEVEKIIRSKLTAREQKVIFMRYGICGYNMYTQMEIASMLGISRSYISRIEKHALEILRATICN